MIQYENLSEAAKQGISNYIGSLPNIRKNFYTKDAILVPSMLYDKASSNNAFPDSYFPCVLLMSFCIGAGATYKEALQAEQFGLSKNYWL